MQVKVEYYPENLMSMEDTVTHIKHEIKGTDFAKAVKKDPFFITLLSKFTH